MKAAVGHWVRHRGTLMWGRVLEVVAQHDGTQEICVDVSRFHPHETNSYVDARDDEVKPGRWWPSYHVDRVQGHEPTDAERRSGRAWAPLGGLR